MPLSSSLEEEEGEEEEAEAEAVEVEAVVEAVGAELAAGAAGPPVPSTVNVSPVLNIVETGSLSFVLLTSDGG